jgi:drug/metabolite transporter (DMT)-like permease
MRAARIGLAIVLAVTATFSFTVADTVSKYLAGHGTPVLQIALARYAVPLGALVLLYVPQRGLRLLRTAHPWTQLARGLLLTSATICMILAMRAMPIAEAQAISFVHPLLLTVLAALVLGERVRPLTWVAVATGFAGLLLIVRPGGGFDRPAALLPLAMALSYSTYQMLTRRLADRDSPLGSLFYVMLVGTAACAVAQPLVWRSPDAQVWALLALAGAGAGLGHLCMIRALGLAPASRLAPFAYVQMVWVVAFGVLVFGNLPDRLTLLGIAVVVGGGLLATLSRRRAHSTEGNDTRRRAAPPSCLQEAKTESTTANRGDAVARSACCGCAAEG